ncbi:MAG: aldo/keto reductase [Granulosicoccus sp.]|nr:aldo/keto reductase [Granulosicoccus sp.]
MNRINLSPELSFSQLVYGMWRIGDDTDTSTGNVEAKIQACLDQGITTFDQADIYGGYTAEAILGATLAQNPGLRNRMEIVTKCDIVAPVGRYSSKRVKHYDTSKTHIEASVNNSLSEMGIEHIDLLLIHRPDPLMDHQETGAALDALVTSGKVRGIGVSNFRPWDWTLLQSGMSQPLLTNQIEISLAEISPFTNGDLAHHQQHHHPVMAWSPLGGGELLKDGSALAQRLDQVAESNGVDRAAVAVAFLLHHPATILPILGTNNLTRIAAISDALNVTLDRESWFELYEAALGHEVA